MPNLEEYRRKRRFDETSEPRGKVARKASTVFVIQKHAARRLHYDLRLEVGGTLKSWAVPKGPSLNPGDKRLAIQVEDHPFEYRKFEGSIPEGNYGAGEVIIWDRGTYEPEGHESTSTQLERGELKFILHGEKLRGSFVLVRLRRSEKKNEWLLIKHRDEYAEENWNIEEHGESVVSGKPLPAKSKPAVARKNKTVSKPPELKGARRASMPSRVFVTLASLEEKPFSDPKWLFEIKWDGVRAVAFVEGGKVRLFARSGRDVTREYPEFHILTKQLQVENAIVDGEIVTLDEAGHSNFGRLQNRIGVVDPSEKLRQKIPVTFYIFDLLYCNGMDLRGSPLLQRKEFLRSILQPSDQVRYSEHQLEKGKELAEAAKQQGLEGIVGKQIDSVYSGSRTPQWVKLKNVNELDAIVVGWTAPRRSRQYFGALVLALYDGKQLEFIGSVGTGFDQQTQKSIFATLQELKVSRSPFKEIPKIREHVEWIRPKVVAKIKYANWTSDKHLRAPAFLSLRKDHPTTECTFANAGALSDADQKMTNAGQSNEVGEEESDTAKVLRKSAPSMSAARRAAQASDLAEEIKNGKSDGLRLEVDGHILNLTHLNKIYFPESRLKKRDLLAYYCGMAPYILPFVKDRPMVLRRHPEGITNKGFFQKEAAPSFPDWLEKATVYSDERGGNMDYAMANNRASLLYLTNLGCIDHNPWSSRTEAQDTPDFVFFDLDPTPGTPFSTVLRVAQCVHKFIRLARLNCFMKTSGATGFHIYIPLEPIYKYDQTRSFAQIVGELVGSQLPKDVTFERTVRKRPEGRVMIDALQNSRGKPLAAVYSVRAEVGAPVSTPITAKELEGEIEPEKWNLTSMHERMRQVGDLWRDFWSKRQTLDKALEHLGKEINPSKAKSKQANKNK